MRSTDVVHNLSVLRRRAHLVRLWCGHARACDDLNPTVDEALANLTEALELYFEDEPPPATPIVRPINIRIPA